MNERELSPEEQEMVLAVRFIDGCIDRFKGFGPVAKDFIHTELSRRMTHIRHHFEKTEFDSPKVEDPQ